MRAFVASVLLGSFVFTASSLSYAEGADTKATCKQVDGESPFATFVLVRGDALATIHFDVAALDVSARWTDLGLADGEMTFYARTKGGQSSGGGLYTDSSGTTLETKATSAVIVFPGKVPAVASFVCSE